MSEYCYFDTLTRTLYESGQAVKVPRKVILLLELFIANANKIVPQGQIIDCLWSSSDVYSEGSIRVYINKLKKYMKRDSLVSIKGIGYKMVL